MNPPRAPAPRCVRGRGRGGGGGAYRPYYFFKRNGRTIPAHGRGTTHPNRGRGGAATTTATSPTLPTRLNNVPPQHAALDSSFMRPQIYAAPEDVQKQVQSIAIETPFPHPGWRLYFYKEPYEANSELVKRIKFMEAHFKTYNSQYDYVRTQNTGCFELKANTLRQDVDLQQNWPTLMNDLLVSPLKTLATIGVAMHSLATSAAIETSATQQKCCKTKYFPKVVRPRKIYVRPSEFMAEGPMARISSLEIDQFYCVRGVVTEMGAVEATASWIAFKCTRCLQEQAIKQTGFNPSRPYTCKRQGCQARQGFIELRCSPFTRITPVQMIRVAEARLDVLSDDENLRTYLDIELKYDLVDTVYLGQEIIVTGSLKMRSLQEEQDYQKTTALTGKMQIFLKAASIKDAKYCKYPYTEKDVEAITMINGEQDCFKLLVHSLAPEVHGHEMVKAGALLSLIGGSGSQVHEETEINVLLVGDPGVGKSGIAQMCAKISLKGCLVQAKRGNTTTGNKLTYLLKGRSNLLLESGGLLAASNGHCSIDDIDRLAAQQEVLINVLQSKMSCMAYPSVFTTFTTPTSVIATANSMRGHYDQSKLLTENIRINTTLLTEFHLVFVMLDKPNLDMDTSLTEHIRALHAGCKKNSVIANKFDKKPKTNNSMNISIENLETQPEEENNYDLNMRLKLSPLEELDLDLLPAILMKKFIAYSRNQVKPLFIAEAADDLRNFYNELRQQAENSQSAISSSHLAGLIRLCQARARIDFSSEVTKLHVRDIICIVKQSNADIALGDYVDTNPAITAQSQRPLGTQSNVRKFIQMLQMRSSALSRRIFDFDELKDMARRVGIQCGVTNLIDIVNLQGLLLKKGPNLYEVMMD